MCIIVYIFLEIIKKKKIDQKIVYNKKLTSVELFGSQLKFFKFFIF